MKNYKILWGLVIFLLLIIVFLLYKNANNQSSTSYKKNNIKIFELETSDKAYLQKASDIRKSIDTVKDTRAINVKEVLAKLKNIKFPLDEVETVFSQRCNKQFDGSKYSALMDYLSKNAMSNGSIDISKLNTDNIDYICNNYSHNSKNIKVVNSISFQDFKYQFDQLCSANLNTASFPIVLGNITEKYGIINIKKLDEEYDKLSSSKDTNLGFLIASKIAYILSHGKTTNIINVCSVALGGAGNVAKEVLQEASPKEVLQIANIMSPICKTKLSAVSIIGYSDKLEKQGVDIRYLKILLSKLVDDKTDKTQIIKKLLQTVKAKNIKEMCINMK